MKYYPFDDSEHQELVARAHALVTKIATKSSGTKLLKGIMPTLELFASYKKNRQHENRHE